MPKKPGRAIEPIAIMELVLQPLVIFAFALSLPKTSRYACGCVQNDYKVHVGILGFRFEFGISDYKQSAECVQLGEVAQDALAVMRRVMNGYAPSEQGPEDGSEGQDGAVVQQERPEAEEQKGDGQGVEKEE